MFGLKKISIGGAFALVSLGIASQALAHPDSLVLTPPLGWNSWNVFHENINEKQIQEIADALEADIGTIRRGSIPSDIRIIVEDTGVRIVQPAQKESA